MEEQADLRLCNLVSSGMSVKAARAKLAKAKAKGDATGKPDAPSKAGAKAKDDDAPVIVPGTEPDTAKGKGDAKG